MKSEFNPRRKSLQLKPKHNKSQKNDGETVDFWKERGIEDVAYQRQAQVTWWTVLGGISVAALLTQLETLNKEIQVGHWYFCLYFLSSCLIIINSWVQTAWGSLVLKWPISIPTSISLFFQGLSMSVAAINITNPNLWYSAISIVVFTAIINQLFFMKKVGWNTFTPNIIHNARKSFSTYILFGIMTIIASIHLYYSDIPIVIIAWEFFALITSVLALIMQHIGMTMEKKSLAIP